MRTYQTHGTIIEAREENDEDMKKKNLVSLNRQQKWRCSKWLKVETSTPKRAPAPYSGDKSRMAKKVRTSHTLVCSMVTYSHDMMISLTHLFYTFCMYIQVQEAVELYPPSSTQGQS